jgi:hypothetical protein
MLRTISGVEPVAPVGEASSEVFYRTLFGGATSLVFVV